MVGPRWMNIYNVTLGLYALIGNPRFNDILLDTTKYVAIQLDNSQLAQPLAQAMSSLSLANNAHCATYAKYTAGTNGGILKIGFANAADATSALGLLNSIATGFATVDKDPNKPQNIYIKNSTKNSPLGFHAHKASNGTEYIYMRCGGDPNTTGKIKEVLSPLKPYQTNTAGVLSLGKSTKLSNGLIL